ncbi:MAG: Uma2 family endonuclease [Anaerolineales bacterium]|nr:Uma2 family endonuclease [Anaerolineales bacterium]
MTEQVIEIPTELARRRATYEEYQALPQSSHLVEWVEGEIIEHMPPTITHQSLVAYLTKLLGLFTDFLGLGQVWSAPIEMRCRPDGNSREPDVVFVATEHLARVANDRRIEGPADVVIEVVSADSVARDLDEKFVEYQECGVPEYWVIDPRPDRRRAFFYQRDAQGRFELIKPEAGIYHSRLIPGFWLKVEWLWEKPDALLTVGEILNLPAEILAQLRARRNR